MSNSRNASEHAPFINGVLDEIWDMTSAQFVSSTGSVLLGSGCPEEKLMDMTALCGMTVLFRLAAQLAKESDKQDELRALCKTLLEIL